VIVAILESPALPPKCPDLLIAIHVALPHEVPRFLGLTFNRKLTHGLPSLLRKIAGGTDQHLRLDSTRLLGGQMQENIASATCADRLEALDAQVVEQGPHVEGRLPVSELTHGLG